LGNVAFQVASLGNRSSLSVIKLLAFDRRCKKYLHAHPMDIVFGMERNFCCQSHYRAGNGCHAAYLERRKASESWLKQKTFALNPLHRLILETEKSTFESSLLKRLFVNSHMVEQEILHYYSCVQAQKISVVHNGVEWKELQMPFEEGLHLRTKLLKQLGLNPEYYHFIFVGNDYERKGLHLLLEALALLPDRHFQLSVIGREKDPQTFIRKAGNLGLREHVHFFGSVKE